VHSPIDCAKRRKNYFGVVGAPPLEELATAGIEVSPEECIQWSNPTFVNSLINADGR
jgi:hypothetical protein